MNVSYSFDNSQINGDLLTLYSNRCCGAPRKTIIHRDRIDYVAYGHYLNYWSLLIGIYFFLFASNTYVGVILVVTGMLFIAYSIYGYFNTAVVIQTASTKFRSGRCSDSNASIVEWFNGAESSVMRPLNA